MHAPNAVLRLQGKDNSVGLIYNQFSEARDFYEEENWIHRIKSLPFGLSGKSSNNR